MRKTTISAGLAVALLAAAAMQLRAEALARSPVRKADAKRIGKGNKGTYTPPNPVLPPNPILPPSPVVPPSPIKR